MRIYLMALCAALALASVVRAQTAPPATIEQLLTAGWSAGPEGRAAADRIYQRFREQNPGSREIDYAYALVRMQQRQYSEAVKSLELYLKFEKDDLRAWQAKAWLSMLLKNYPQAMSDMDQLSQRLAAAMAEETRDEVHQELVRFLGRMIGYLEGPASSSVSATAVQDLQRKIAGRLTETALTSLEEGRSAVEDQFTVLTTSKDDTQAQEIAAAQKAKRETLAALDKEEEEAGERQEAIKTSAKKLQEEAKAEEEQYARADRPLAEQVARLGPQIASLEREYSIVTSDIISLRAQAERERDPILRDRLFRESDRLELVANRVGAELTTLERRAAAIQSERATLAARFKQSQAGYAASLGKLSKESQTIDSRLKRVNAFREKLAKPATGNTGKVIAISKQAEALTTYVVFPLQEERQRLLE